MYRINRSLFLVLVYCLLCLGSAQSLSREIRARILEAVVQVIPLDEATGGLTDTLGSGTIISPDGYVLTNYHVIGDLDTHEHVEWHSIWVTDPKAPEQQPQYRYRAQYVSGDPIHDLAILKIVKFASGRLVPADMTFTAVPVGDSNALIPGDMLTVVGYPGVSGDTITFTAGLMSGWLGEDFYSGGKQWIKTDAKIAGGNSGGAAFDENGYLVGVPTAGHHVLEGVVYEEQLYIRPIGLAWSLIDAHVPNVVRAPNVPSPAAQTPPQATPVPSAVVPSRTGGSGHYGTVAMGETRSGTLAAKVEDEPYIYHTYVVEVPAGVSTLTISVDGGTKDVDLATNAGADIMNYSDADHVDISKSTDPSYTYENPAAGPIYIDIISFLPESAPYTLHVQATATEAANPLDATPAVTASTPDSATIGGLQIGQSATGQLRGLDNAISYHTYYVDVPAGTSRLVISMNADEDLDLAAKFGSEIASYSDQDEGGDWTYRDLSMEPSAEFTIDNPLAGRWYIDVFNYRDPSVVSSYTLKLRQ